MSASRPLGYLALVAVFAAVAFLASAGAQRAEAAFPGGSGTGEFVFEQDGDIHAALYDPDFGFLYFDRYTSSRAREGNPASSPYKMIAYERGGGIWVFNHIVGIGGRETRVTDGKMDDRDPAWSPDGTEIVFSRRLPSGDRDVFAMKMDGSGQRNLTNTPDNYETGPAWSPRGDEIAYTRAGCEDPDGGRANAGTCVYKMKADGSQQINLTPEDSLAGCEDQARYRHRGKSRQPNWSADRGRIAFTGTVSCPNSSGSDIWVMRANGSGKTNLTDDQGTVDDEPAFSPGAVEYYDEDGQYAGGAEMVAFTSNRPGPDAPDRIYQIRSDGNDTPPITPISFNGTRDADYLTRGPLCGGTEGADNITGTPDRDVLCGGGGDDTINGAGGNDIIYGGDGNDRITGGPGTDYLNGGQSLDSNENPTRRGSDTVFFPGRAPVKASLTAYFATGQGDDVLVGVENLTGSGGNDTLTGDPIANVIVGGPGADRLAGDRGNDTMNSRDGVNGNDTVGGDTGDDRCLTDARERAITGCP